MTVFVPGRFAYGIIFAAELCLLMPLGTLFKALLRLLRVRHMKSVSMLVMIVSFTMLFRQLLVLCMPDAALQLGFVLYLPSVSTFSTVFLFDERILPLRDEMKTNMQPALLFSAYMLLFSLGRDLIGYGTVTLPALNKMYEKVLFGSETVSALGFFATVPGALTLSALFLVFFLAAERKLQIVGRAGPAK